MNIEQLRASLQCGKQSCLCTKPRGNAHCPSHEDSQPSLSITQGRTALLFKCFKGCETPQIITALKERGLWESSANVTPMRPRNEPDHLYRYVTAEGELLAEKGRWDNPKRFAWRKPDERWGETPIPMHEMPLYGLQNVLQSPDAPVWVVEGEKAQQACISRGLVAVCLAGGASQNAFGNALDPLMDRDVILWPDNDAPGQALMAKIAGIIPQAKYVRPALPEKGDAHDYFAQGGTVDGLKALLKDGQPVTRSTGADSIEVMMPHPGGAVTFQFSEMSWTARSLDAIMNVDVRVTGVPQSPYSTRLNLNSASGREGIRRELEQVFGKQAIEWSRMLATSCSEAGRVWREVDLSVDLAEVDPAPRQWFLDQRLPLNTVNIVFGMGGTGKSFLVLDMAMHAMMDAMWLDLPMEPIKSILIMDYEDTEDEWRIRAEQFCEANGWEFPTGRIRYLPGSAIPIHEQKERVRALVREHEVGLVIVDSASSASGGDLLDAQSVSRVVNFLQSLGVTVVMTAHNTKAEDSQYPYGNVAWHNLVRSTHYVQQTQEEGSRTASIAMWNRKGNRGRQRPIGIVIQFPDADDGPIYITRDDSAIDLTASQESPGTVRWRIWEWLGKQQYPCPVVEIAEALNLDETLVRKELNRGRPGWFINRGDAKKGLWGAVDRSRMNVS